MAASNLLKRVRLGSDETDIECQKRSKIVNENIACSGCKLRYCLKCAKINVALYNCIQAGDMDEFMWSCTSCRATFPSLENITSTLNDLKNQMKIVLMILKAEKRQLKKEINKTLRNQSQL